MAQIERYEQAWTAEEADLLHSVSDKVHIGGLSALVHYGLTTAIPGKYHVYADPKDVAAVQAFCDGKTRFVKVMPRAASNMKDVVEGVSRGKKVRISNVYRAIVEMLLAAVDDDCKKETVFMVKAQKAIPVGRIVAAAYPFGDAARRRVEAYFVSCKA